MITKNQRETYDELIDRIVTIKSCGRKEAHQLIKKMLSVDSIHELSSTRFKKLTPTMEAIIAELREAKNEDEYDDQSDGCFSGHESNLPEGFEGIDD